MNFRAHGREVDEQRHASEVLQDDAGDDKRDFIIARGRGGVASEVFDILLGHFFAIAIPHE